MATTSKGIVYPTSSDNIAPLETHFSALASSVNTVLVRASGTTQFTGPAAAGGIQSVSVSFPSAFSTAPKVTATVQTTDALSGYAVNIVGAPTTTGFTAMVYRLNGSGANSGLNLVWHAFE
jgi:hypothetical protein